MIPLGVDPCGSVPCIGNVLVCREGLAARPQISQSGRNQAKTVTALSRAPRDHQDRRYYTQNTCQDPYFIHYRYLNVRSAQAEPQTVRAADTTPYSARFRRRTEPSTPS